VLFLVSSEMDICNCGNNLQYIFGGSESGRDNM